MNSHLSQRELLLYVDGELPGRKVKTAQAHLLSCWSCRTELERLEQDIILIVDAQNRAFLPAISPPGRPWASFDDIAATAPKPRYSLGAWRRFATRLQEEKIARWALAAASLACVVVVSMWIAPAPLSAEGVLQKLNAADLVRSRVASGQAIRQRIRVRRIDGQSSASKSTELEFWKSGERSLWRGDDNDLHRRYRSRDIDAILPLSAPACERWLSETGGKPVVSVNGGTVEIRSDGSADLKSVAVKVRSDNWHVEAMQLTFADSVFDLSELDLAVMKSDEMSPVLVAALGSSHPSNPVSTGTDIADGPVAILPATEASSKTPAINFPELELRIQARLHEIGADLSEPIELKLESPNIVIAATGAAEERKQQLLKMFGGDARIRLDLDAKTPSNGNPVTEVLITRPYSTNGPDKQLTAFFGSSELEERFTRELLATDESILARMYALRTLAARWPSDVEATLSAEARAELRTMVADHTLAIRADVPKIKTSLAPLAEKFCSDIALAARNPGAELSWRDFASSGLSTARLLDRSLRATFTTSANATSIGQSCPALTDALASLESDLAGLSAGR